MTFCEIIVLTRFGVSQLVSSVSGDDCVWILGHLHALRAFLDKNSQLSLLNWYVQVMETHLT